MKYFSIQELTDSETARRFGIDNTPPDDKVEALKALVDNVLDPIREAWGKPVTVNSGYRCVLLNARVKGAPDSQHTRGEAADITAGSKMENRKLFNVIKHLAANGVIEFDQLIDEQGYQWLHVSYTERRANRGQVLHM